MPLLDVDLQKAKQQYEVNLWGVLAVTQAFFPILREAKGPHVVLTRANLRAKLSCRYRRASVQRERGPRIQSTVYG